MLRLPTAGLRGQSRSSILASGCALSGIFRCWTVTPGSTCRTSRGDLFGADGHEPRSRDGRPWKAWLKGGLWPHIFGLADVVVVASSGGVALMKSLGIAPERVVLTLNVVDNDWWLQQAVGVDVARIRHERHV